MYIPYLLFLLYGREYNNWSINHNTSQWLSALATISLSGWWEVRRGVERLVVIMAEDLSEGGGRVLNGRIASAARAGSSSRNEEIRISGRQSRVQFFLVTLYTTLFLNITIWNCKSRKLLKLCKKYELADIKCPRAFYEYFGQPICPDN